MPRQAHPTHGECRPGHRRLTVSAALALAYGLAGGPQALAQTGAPAPVAPTVYRCGNSYSQWPCADPATPARALDLADPRSADQRQAAREAARHDAEALRTLQAEREKRERDERQAQAAQERANMRAQQLAADQARAAERAAQAEQQRREREMIILPRKATHPAASQQANAAGPKPFTAVNPPPGRSPGAPSKP